MKNLYTLKGFTLILFTLLFSTNIYAQEYTAYHMRKNQQIHILNPAMTGECNFYFSLPGFSFIQPGIENRGLQVLQILENPSDLKNILEPVNSFNFDLQYEILSFGFKIRKSYLSLSISDKTNFNIAIPRDFFIFLWEGNKNYIGKTLNFNDFNFDLNNYLEYSFGYSYQLKDNLRIGGKFKILNGIINLNTKKWEMGIYTAPNTYELDLYSNLLLNSSLPVEIQLNSENSDVIEDFPSFNNILDNYNFFTKNIGFGLDFGASYDLSEKINFSASVIDLFSYIRWNTGVNNISQNGSYNFSGLDLNPLIYADGQTNEDLINDLTDTLKNTFEFHATQNGYTDYINPKYFIGGKYKFSEWFDAGALISGRYYNNHNYMSYSLSGNTFLLRFLSLSASYTIFGSGSSNLGLGLGFKIGPAQLFFASDNILGIRYDSNLNIPWTNSSQNLDFMFGFNLAFGCKKKPVEPIVTSPE